MKNFFFIAIAVILTSCSVKPKGTFSEQLRPLAPDYSKTENWAALPTKNDAADLLPTTDLKDNQADAPIDVFYLYPTIYSGAKGETLWNAPVNDAEFNAKVDSTAIKNHAAIFNGVGKVYAPRYRQAHLNSYAAYEEEKRNASAKAAFALAYEDVKAAFQYYLDNYNQGRPFIIASHSQGTTHAKVLLKEMIDGTKLQNRMVAAYLIGIPVAKDYFKKIPLCATPQMTGCFCAWRTYKEGSKPKNYTLDNNIAVVNPVTWTTEETPSPKSEHKGAIFYDYNKVYSQITTARVFDGFLYVNKPKFPGSIFLIRKNYHIADLNLFWLDIRENAKYREGLFWKY